MNCEEYIVERLQKLEKENEHLKKLVDLKDEVIDSLNTKVKALYNLYDKAQLKFEDEGSYYSLEFKGIYFTLTDDGKEDIKEIINDLKVLDIDSDNSDIVKATETFERKKASND